MARRRIPPPGEELERFVAAAHPLGVTVVEDRYDPQEFYSAVAGLENEPERGSRCTVCYRLRMRRAAQYAAEHGFDWFTTTLSISPHKDAKRINAIGQELEAEFGVKHLPSDFKKHNGYLRSLQLSEEYGLYRQDYCGCEFSDKGQRNRKVRFIIAKLAKPAGFASLLFSREGVVTGNCIGFCRAAVLARNWSVV